MRSLSVLAVVMLALSGPALADRPVTAEEKVSLDAALQAQGCSGGKMEFDDGKFEVDKAQCSDGKKYDLDFDASFKLIKKKLDD